MLRRFKIWEEVREEQYFTRYRMEIVKFTGEEIYMTDDLYEIMDWLLNESQNLESGATIFFYEKIEKTHCYEEKAKIRKD